MRYSTRADIPPNQCLECGEIIRRPKRFCNDEHKEIWLVGAKKFTPAEIEAARQTWTADREWKRKLSLSRPF